MSRPWPFCASFDRPEWFPRQRYAADILAKLIGNRRTLSAEMRELADAVSLPL
jgi:hypothetical protein